MSKPKTYPPYSLDGEGTPDVWIVDAHGNTVVYRVDLSLGYDENFRDRIMQIICDALNQQKP